MVAAPVFVVSWRGCETVTSRAASRVQPSVGGGWPQDGTVARDDDVSLLGRVEAGLHSRTNRTSRAWSHKASLCMKYYCSCCSSSSSSSSSSSVTSPPPTAVLNWICGGYCISEYNAQCTILNALCTMRNSNCTMHNEQCKLQNTKCTMQNAKCKMHNAQCTMHNAK